MIKAGAKFLAGVLALAASQSVACATEFESIASLPGYAEVVFTWDDEAETLTLRMQNWAPVELVGTQNTGTAINSLLIGLDFGENISGLFTLTSCTADILQLDEPVKNGGTRPLGITVTGRGTIPCTLTSTGVSANGVLFGPYTNPMTSSLNSGGINALMQMYNGSVYGGEAVIVLKLKEPNTFDVTTLDRIPSVQFVYNAGINLPGGRIAADLTPVPGPYERIPKYGGDTGGGGGGGVPEPSTLAVLGFGAVGLLVRRCPR